ncbi:MAG: hypothetical protein A2204_05365 [Elusimicrobia bacterium RIFOXYA1_FULL_47_7]|nr:MAG: hypothetical protein A2278_00780 [Elusimicrobia bacterium RIFOXYA12_FULL_49_49]OGS09869.1 MAG: hypothetical protein A2204_05365 [Elusimicrobia bacterium RIFOXYA1_FULL_47_7]OGS10649.1 MAG: hypothetical protein A2386_00670 [Elusimicrobia bacterium RIFOXYB1_FULL_48_9]OGS15076.1 MAG: hypothetical protein A2251_00260 [Elusimicrobia bacterium RIFOXYA2_FULL_47_53]OGS29414.1 MAG: hypothetical protein A2323_00545 [Elusimicrobia bacterium RIFOXYB2_FULL_46_23]
MIKRLLTAFFLLLPAAVFSASLTLDDFNNRTWFGPTWGNRPMLVSWASQDSRNVVKATSVGTVENYMIIRSKSFPVEDWQNVVRVRADIKADFVDATSSLKFEMKNNTGGLIQAVTYSNVPNGTWTDIVWDVSPGATPVALLDFVMDGLGANECTYYFDNLRLVMQNGTTQYWDYFESQPMGWSGNGDVVSFNADSPEFLSHNKSTDSANSGAGYFQWQFSAGYAELQITGKNYSWSNYNTLKADVMTSDVLVPMRFTLWYGAKSEGESVDRYAVSTNTWTTMYWPLPQGTTAWNVTEFKAGIVPTALHSNGTYYVDNIIIGKVNVTVVKSTSAAIAMPGSDVTVTLNYANSGDMEATNTYLTDAIPFNCYVPEAAANGSADSVEYFVGSAWQGGHSEAATKIRFKDSFIAAGASGLSVSYKIRIR